MYPKNDEQYREDRVATFRDGAITDEDGWSIGLPEGFRAEVGETVRYYGEGIGRPVRGLFIGGRKAWYRTVKEQREHDRKQSLEYDASLKRQFGERREEMDATFASLPGAFQQRIERFRRNNPDFRWKYERYELFACQEAVKIARQLKTEEAIEEWSSLSWNEQTEQVSLDDGHSGNTLGIATRLAWLFVGEDPGRVVRMHGALAPLVGSEEYGCVPRPTPCE